MPRRKSDIPKQKGRKPTIYFNPFYHILNRMYGPVKITNEDDIPDPTQFREVIIPGWLDDVSRGASGCSTGNTEVCSKWVFIIALSNLQELSTQSIMDFLNKKRHEDDKVGERYAQLVLSCCHSVIDALQTAISKGHLGVIDLETGELITNFDYSGEHHEFIQFYSFKKLEQFDKTLTPTVGWELPPSYNEYYRYYTNSRKFKKYELRVNAISEYDYTSFDILPYGEQHNEKN